MDRAASGPRTLGNAERVTQWLASADGRRAVHGALRRMGLPSAFDTDLEDATIHAARRMDARGETIDAVAAWTGHTLRWRARDLARSPVSSRVAAHDDREWDAWPGATDHHDTVAFDLDVAALRRRLGTQWSTAPPPLLSAALTYLTITLDDAACGAGCPAPAAGADELDRAHWAGLHYAGMADCFAADDTPAIRQRRKRRIDQVRQLLIDVHATAREGRDA